MASISTPFTVSPTGGGGAEDVVGDGDRLFVTGLSIVLVFWVFFLLLFSHVLGAIITKLIAHLKPDINARIGKQTRGSFRPINLQKITLHFTLFLHLHLYF